MDRLTERLKNGVINVKYASQHETAIHCGERTKMSRPDATSHQIAPCKGCSERYIACHDHCERFKNTRQSAKRKTKQEGNTKENRLFATTPSIIDKTE